MGKIVAIVLGVFVAASIAYVVYGELETTAPQRETQQPEQSPPDEPNKDAVRGPVVTAYYFHRTQRCTTCLGIESGAKHVIEEQFAGQIADQTLVWQLCNLDEPVNEHFVEDFSLSFSSLVLVEEQGGKTVRWKNLDKVWDVAHAPEELERYVVEETRRFIEGS